MNAQEFAGWWANLKTRFPSVRAWIAKHAPNPDSQQAMLKTWREVLADAPHAEAMVVLSKMQAGDLPWLAEFEPIDRLPQHVRRLARQIAWEAEGGDAPEPPPLKGPSQLGPLLKRWQQLATDLGEDEARRIALEEFPIKTLPGREPRYDCHLCLDQQVVEVASTAAIRAMLQGRFVELMKAHRSGVMRCRCDARKSDKFKMASYDPTLDFKIQDHLWRPAEVERFAAWVEWQREHSATARAQANPRYDPALAGFNA